MRELTSNEIDLVSGGAEEYGIISKWTWGTAIGSVGGGLATSTLRGAAIGGWFGGAIGLSFGLGYAAGTIGYGRVRDFFAEERLQPR